MELYAVQDTNTGNFYAVQADGTKDAAHQVSKATGIDVDDLEVDAFEEVLANQYDGVALLGTW